MTGMSGERRRKMSSIAYTPSSWGFLSNTISFRDGTLAEALVVMLNYCVIPRRTTTALLTPRGPHRAPSRCARAGRRAHTRGSASVRTRRSYALNDGVILALHVNADNAVGWRGKAMSNRQAFKRGTESASPARWTDSLWPEIQAASGCQAPLCFDTRCCPQQNERGKTAARGLCKHKIHPPFVF